MIDKEKKKLNMKVQWTKFAVVTLLYLIFLYWLESWLGLIVVPFIFDVYITKKIRWQWWKDSELQTFDKSRTPAQWAQYVQDEVYKL